ncbi:hypothetical protein C6503_19230 [Candidatus Poribacteria bacterium]|nr:MAG: hypothetical protein C6503_19230 [Candidatus Poribacteria bacterium]
MAKERVSSDIDRKLRIEADKKANELGISRAKLIEISLESELGRFNVHKENKRLTERVKTSEQDIAELQHQLTTAETEHKDTRDRLEHEKTALRDELKAEKVESDRRWSENQKLIGQRDVFEERAKSLEKERDKFKANLKQIASHLGVPDTVKHCKQRIDELQASIEDKKRERNHFKAQAEEAQSKLNVCDTKLTLLLTRTWWERLWNVLPWIE